ncbi:hypothetical protein Q7P36_006369 [Cladosporium allicinum]
MMRFNLLARPAFPCLVAMFGGVWGTNGNGALEDRRNTRRDVSRGGNADVLLLQCCYWGLGCNHNRWRILQAVSLVLSPAVLISQPTPLMQSVSGSMTLAIPIRPGSTVAHTQSKASDMLVCQPSSAIRSARSDNLAASIAPVSRGRIGHAARRRTAFRSTDDHGEPNNRDIDISALCCGPIFGRVLTLGPCRTWQSCTQSHRHPCSSSGR